MNKIDILELLNKELSKVDHARQSHLSRYIVDPYTSKLERFKHPELVFVVARGQRRVVFFDDVEEEFATALESGQYLSKIAYLGELTFALEELDRLESS